MFSSGTTPCACTLAMIIAASMFAPGCGEKSIPARVTPEAIAQSASRDDAARAAEEAELKRLLTGGELAYSLDFVSSTLPEGAVTERLPEEAAPARWRIENGWLRNDDAKNQGIWVEALPEGDGPVRIEFRAISRKPPGNRPFPGDIKCEAFATAPKHEAGYSFINGGWSNQFDTIARIGEHSADDRRKAARAVEDGREYHYAIIRRGTRLDWVRDGELLYTFEDKDHVNGRWFGFNNWLSDVAYRDLKVWRLTL